MNNKHYKALIMRPEEQGRTLANTLSQAGYSSLCVPLFNYQTLAFLNQYQDLLTPTPDIIIFVSVAAVTYAHHTLPLKHWPKSKVIAVGKATREKLTSLGVTSVISPEPQTSEGLLNLNVLSHPEHKKIIIVRGNGGRELIAETLTQRGATVSYIESYQRCWKKFPKNISHQWQQFNVNCMVITSNEILQSVVQLVKGNDYFWQSSCVWIVASERIANNAAQLGLQRIICSHGASDEAILMALRKTEQAHDRKKNTHNQRSEQ